MFGGSSDAELSAGFQENVISPTVAMLERADTVKRIFMEVGWDCPSAAMIKYDRAAFSLPCDGSRVLWVL